MTTFVRHEEFHKTLQE